MFCTLAVTGVLVFPIFPILWIVPWFERKCVLCRQNKVYCQKWNAAFKLVQRTYIYIYIYIYISGSIVFIVTTLLLSHVNSYVIYLFSIFSFLYLNFSSPLLSKKKKKDLFFSLLIHTYCYIFFPTFFSSFLSLNLPTTFNFMVTLLSSSFIYFDSSSLHFILYRFDIVFFIQSIFPPPPTPPTKTMSTLSLSVDFCSFLYL